MLKLFWFRFLDLSLSLCVCVWARMCASTETNTLIRIESQLLFNYFAIVSIYI